MRSHALGRNCLTSRQNLILTLSEMKKKKEEKKEKKNTLLIYMDL